MEYRDLKREFLLSAIQAGVEESLPPKMQEWWKKFRKPVVVAGTGRWANKFAIRVSVEFLGVSTTQRVAVRPRQFGVVGKGFIGTTKKDAFRARSAVSRKLVEVLAGLGMSFSTLPGIDVMPGKINRVRVEFTRKNGQVLREMDAVERAVGFVASLVGVKGDSFLALRPYVWRIPSGFAEDPWKLFLVLTVMKLAVLRPELWEHNLIQNRREKLQLVLAWWQGLDDDARTAYLYFRVKADKENPWDLHPIWNWNPKLSWISKTVELKPEAIAKIKSILERKPQDGKWPKIEFGRVEKGTYWAAHVLEEEFHDLWVQGGLDLRAGEGYVWRVQPGRVEFDPKAPGIKARLIASGYLGLLGTPAKPVVVTGTKLRSKKLY